MYHSFLIHSSADGHLGCFHVLAIINQCLSLVLEGQSGSDDKKSACSMGDQDLILGLRISLGGGNGNPLQYSCLEISRDRGAWQFTIPGVTELDMPE